MGHACQNCMTRMPYATLLATILCLVAIGVISRLMFEEVFHFHVDWIDSVQLAFVTLGASMGALGLMILFVGFLTTGETRRSVYKAWKAPVGGRISCAVDYPMAVVGTANPGLIIYQLENTPSEYKRIDSPLKYQHRCIAIFRDKKNAPTGFALGSVEGRVAIQYLNAPNPKDNFTFKCHRSNGTNNGYQDIFPVNDIKFHPIHGTLATVGSDGRYSFWDKDARTKLKTSDAMDLPISCCAFNSDGQIFAYACSYDWSRGYEHHNPAKRNAIYLHPCMDDLKPRNKT